MNPFLQDQIDELRATGNPSNKAQATLMEMMYSGDARMSAIEASIAGVKKDVGEARQISADTLLQATKTNGRMNRAEDTILKHTEEVASLRTLVLANKESIHYLTVPAERLRWTWKFVGKVSAIAVVITTLVFGLLSTPVMRDRPSQAEVIEAAVAKALKDSSNP